MGSLKLFPLPHTTYSLFPIPKLNNNRTTGWLPVPFCLFSISAIAPWTVVPYFCKRQFYDLCALFGCVCEDKYEQHKIIVRKKMGHYSRCFVETDRDTGQNIVTSKLKDCFKFLLPWYEIFILVWFKVRETGHMTQRKNTQFVSNSHIYSQCKFPWKCQGDLETQHHQPA